MTNTEIRKEIERIQNLPKIKAQRQATPKDMLRAKKYFDNMKAGKIVVSGMSTDNPIAEEYKVLFDKIMKKGFYVKHCGNYCSTRYILSIAQNGKFKNVVLINTGKKAPRIQMLKANLPENYKNYHQISGYQLDTVPHNLTYDNILAFLDSCQF